MEQIPFIFEILFEFSSSIGVPITRQQQKLPGYRKKGIKLNSANQKGRCYHEVTHPT